MSGKNEEYLACTGLPRLLLHCAVYILRSATQTKDIAVSSVLEHARTELIGRGQALPTPGRLEQALDESLQTGWLKEEDGCVAVADEGWRAYGHTVDRQPLTIHGDEPEHSLADAAALVLRILLEVQRDSKSKSATYRMDPRVNPQGEVLVEDLRLWANSYGLENKIFEDAVAVLVRHGLVEATDVGSDGGGEPSPSRTDWVYVLLKASGESTCDPGFLQRRVHRESHQY